MSNENEFKIKLMGMMTILASTTYFILYVISN